MQTLEKRIRKLEGMHLPDEVEITVAGNKFYLGNEGNKGKELTPADLQELSENCKKIVGTGFIYDSGMEILDNIIFSCPTEIHVKGYVGPGFDDLWED